MVRDIPREGDPRYWILNPSGHRLNAELAMLGRDGEMVESAIGPAQLIVPPAGEPTDWVCDLCSQPILVRWGEEPFPVPMYASNALCLDHFNEAKDWPFEDGTGTEYPFPYGEWPAQLCSCSACRFTMSDWFPQLKLAYEMTDPVFEA